jgi:surface protein
MNGNSFPITAPEILTAFNTQPFGTVFTPSIVTTHIQGSFPTGDIITTHNVTNFIPRQNTPTLSLATLPSNLTTGSTFSLAELVTKSGTGVLAYSSSHPSVATVNSSTGLVTLVSIGTTTITVSLAASSDGVYAAATLTTEIVVTGPLLTLAANGVTIKYTGTEFTSNPLFIQANPRGTLSTPQTPQPEWFAVVPSNQYWRITSYATNDVENGISYFTPPGQSNPVPFNNIVTTLLTNMSDLFNNATTFNEDISSWDTSSVTNMGNMFSNASDFNKPLNSWDTALVGNMVAMFYNAEKFNQNIGSWDTSIVTTMEYMFQEAIAFNNGGSPNIGDWDVSIVSNMSNMFQNAQAFNQNISNWDVSAVTEGNFNNFRAGSALTQANTPPAFLPPITLAANGVTIKYTGSAGDIPDSTPLFIQANPRDTLQNPRQPEWFAVVKDISSDQINSYAKNQEGGINYFTPSAYGETIPVPFNNIVTTHMQYNMGNLFNNATTFNEDISSWDTSNATDMFYMFYNATAFDKDISSWDTSKVEYMYGTFNNASAFNKNIGSWNTSKVTRMDGMFDGASAFNQPIGSWDTALVRNMFYMFNGASAFNQPIGSWNTSKVENMNFMFNNAIAFDKPLNSWDTALVTSMIGMFSNSTSNASAFNQNIGSWDTSIVSNMSHMFDGASVFNNGGSPNIGDWDVSSVIDISFMFQNAQAFNQNISNWDVSSVTENNFYNFRAGSVLTQANTPPAFR